jgi:hypothetical protein
MSAAHTPGPWGYARSATPEWFYLATVYADDDGFKRVAMAFESEADARLIAAAPELLEALRALVDCPDYAGIQTHEMRRARAAITKATREG